MTNEADEVESGVGNGRTTTLGKEDPMDGPGWLGVMVVVYVLIVALIIAALVLHFTVNRNADELRWDNAGLAARDWHAAARGRVSRRSARPRRREADAGAAKGQVTRQAPRSVPAPTYGTRPPR